VIARRLGAAAVSLVWTAMLAGTPCAQAGPSRDAIKQKQAEVHATHLKLQHEQAVLDQAKVRVQSLQAQIAETDRNIARVNAHLDTLEYEVASNRRKLSWNQKQLDAANASLERYTDALRHRLVDAYERGGVTYLNVLLASTSFSDFVERWEDIRLLIDGNQRTVRERREAELKVAAVQRDLQAAQTQLDASEARERQTRLALDALDSQRRTLFAVADGQRRQVAQQVTELEGISASEESSLEALIVQRQREEAARRAAAEAAAREANRGAGLAGESPAPESGSGPFSWPVAGPITSPFGSRTDPYGSGASDFHPGIDIGAPMGATVTAAADGQVIFAGWYGGYGNAVIIDHGSGVSTLYGHMSQLFVSEHQSVQRGQAIGAVGSTGHSTGPHLHFEVRVNGSPTDPLSKLH
jgi:murein DD-endopeptidase MepM/ murein hydrolase activator NlpD